MSLICGTSASTYLQGAGAAACDISTIAGSTMMCWLFCHRLSSGGDIIRIYSVDEYIECYILSTGRFQTYVKPSGAGANINSSTVGRFGPGAWVHWCLVIDGSVSPAQWTYYINGIPDGGATFDIASFSAPTQIRIGNFENATLDPVNLCHLKQFDAPLTQEQIRAEMFRTTPVVRPNVRRLYHPLWCGWHALYREELHDGAKNYLNAITGSPRSIDFEPDLLWRYLYEYGIVPAGGPTLISVADSGAGVDSIAFVLAKLNLADAGAGADGIAGLKNRLTIADAGAGSDALSQLLARLGIADSGVGTDLISGVLNKITSVDAGSGADAINKILTKLSLSETGSGAETLAIVCRLTRTDAGAGTDSISVSAGDKKSVTDAGAGADSISNVIARLTILDSAAGADLIANLIVRAGIVDAGSGADAVSRLVKMLLADAGAGADSVSPLPRIFVTDIGSSSELAAIAGKLTVIDLGTGTETIIISGTGIFKDVISLVGYITREISGKASIAIDVTDEGYITLIISERSKEL